MAENNGGVLTERHLGLFGSIVQWFAQYELTIQRAIAGIMKAELPSVVVLTRELDFMQKRAALLDVMKVRRLPSDHWERIFAYLAVPAARVRLRDQIARSTWRSSPEPHSIQPNWILQLPAGIEPADLGPVSNSTSYPLDMLRQIAADLAESHERFVAYLAEAGFLAS